LSECDWTQLFDAPLTQQQKDAWASYRQELRDVTEQENPHDIAWPDAPA
jgi:hypothetical protein